MKLFELLPCVDLPGQRSLTIAPPIDLLVKQALARLERRPSRQWLDAVRDMETGGPVRLEVSLEELALLLERVDFSSSRLEDIEAMKFWSHLEASCELLEALGHEWSKPSRLRLPRVVLARLARPRRHGRLPRMAGPMRAAGAYAP